MDVVTIDFETYYDKDYSLSKITTEEYIRSPLFEVIGVGVKVNNGPVDTYSGSDVGKFLRSLDYSDKAILCHNTMFDGAILSWKYGIKPRLWLDTLSMARPLHQATVGGSLKALAQYYELGQKGEEVVHAMGKRRRDFSPAELAAYMRYCANDIDLTYALFKKLCKGFPVSELRVIDTTIRMYTQPMIELDRGLLEAHHDTVVLGKQALLDSLGGGGKDIIMSNDKFAKLLRRRGVEPPTKTSPTTGKETYAFAKTDLDFVALQEHPDPVVQTLVSARLGLKSTLEETRTKRLVAVADRGRLPIMLNYYGAHCVPGDTEVLTRNGWERLDVWGGGQVAQWYPDSGEIEFLDAEPYVGPVIDKWVVSKAPYMPVDMTPGHTVPVLTHGSRKLQPTPAADLLFRGSSYIPTSGELVHGKTFTPEQTRVLVMVQADGSFEIDSTRGRRLSVFLKKPRKIERARELLTAAGVEFVEQSYPSWPGYVRFVVRGRDYPKWLSPERKVFGPWVLHCHLNVFLDELKHWDGWVQGGQVCYSTSDPANAEWVQTVAHLSNMGCAMSAREGKGNRRTNYSLRLRKRAECMVKLGHLTLIDKEQQAYCVKSKTGYWLARANGHIFVTGNTGRFSGGDKMNLQNLPRGGALRHALRAPAGYKIVSCDSSQIEARMVAYIAGQADLVQQFREGRDVYSEFATKFYGRPVSKADKLERHVGKAAILGLGYGMSAEKFQLTLKRGKPPVDLPDEDVDRLVHTYRTGYHHIVKLWGECGYALSAMVAGRKGRIGAFLTYSPDGIELPNGMKIRYHGLTATDRQFTYIQDRRMFERAMKARMGGDAKDVGSGTIPGQSRIYGAMVAENCLAGDTQVLTRRGWTPIVEVRGEDQVWDGVQWVTHGGLTYQGDKPTTVVDGVRMTPDHKVLTSEGWVRASSCEGLYRSDFWLPDGSAVSGHERPPFAVGVPVQMRDGGGARGDRRREVGRAWRDFLLWVCGSAVEQGARHDQTSGILGVAIHAGSVSATLAPSVAQLWSTRHQGLPSVGQLVRGVLAGHGTDVRAGAYFGPQGQQRRLYAGELQVGPTYGAGREQARGATRGHRQSAQTNGRPEGDAALPVAAEPVYDLLNAGPNSRFMVRGSSGPFVVHNCTQALARIVVAEQMLKIRDAGYHVAFQVHDENVCVVSEDQAEQAEKDIVAIMSTPPDWAPDLPVACEAGTADTYGET